MLIVLLLILSCSCCESENICVRNRLTIWNFCKYLEVRTYGCGKFMLCWPAVSTKYLYLLTDIILLLFLFDSLQLTISCWKTLNHCLNEDICFLVEKMIGTTLHICWGSTTYLQWLGVCLGCMKLWNGVIALEDGIAEHVLEAPQLTSHWRAVPVACD